jgi:hypothetical protein
MANDNVVQDADDFEARRQLAFDANFEISKLAEVASKICRDDDHPAYHGIMARIQTLSEIVHHVLRLGGGTDEDVGRPELRSLERVYKGMLA